MNISDNICIGHETLSLLRNRKGEESLSKKFVDAFNIRCTSVRNIVRNLSGGNQQERGLAVACTQPEGLDPG